MLKLNENKGLLVLFVMGLFCSSSVFSTDVIDMRGEPQLEKISESNELLLFNNYIDTFNGEKFVSTIAPHYDSMVLTIDDYSMTIYFDDVGVEKIVEGEISNYDMKLDLDKENIVYLMNNWYSMDTFDKMKYVINLDMPISNIIRLSGIAMSVK